MRRLIDLTGKRFGRLIVIKRSFPNNNQRQPNWLCKCDCGKEKVILGMSLKSGFTKSCGCLQRENMKNVGNLNRLKPGLACMRRLIGVTKRRSKRLGLDFNLTEKEYFTLTQQDCYYCGAKPENVLRHKESNGDYIYNGLDRVDNNKGYTIDNVVPCCRLCNYGKRNLTIQEFKDWISKIYNRLKL